MTQTTTTATTTAPRGALAGYRVLDLADEKGALAGKLFADMGADVIKVEPPDGCSTRRILAFLDGIPGPDRSLYFISYAAGKRSVTVDLESLDGRQLFGDLANTADFIIESYPLGHLDALGLGYETLAEHNPRLIYCSITPFGDKGPAAHWKAADVVTWAAGGMMFLTGKPGRPPLQLSFPQAGLHAGSEAAVSSMLAHMERLNSGKGQRVIVDMQACVAWCLMNESGFPVLHGDFVRRNGGRTGSDGIARKARDRCADGFVAMTISGAPSHIHHVQGLIDWMDENDALPDWIREIDFSTWTVRRFVTDATPEFLKLMRDTEDEVERFLMRFTRKEIYEVADKRRMLVAPVATIDDVAADEQLAAREYFQEVDHQALGRTLTLPGPFVRMSTTPLVAPRPSPSLGAHNDEIYCGELGRSRAELQRLYSTRVI